jgi:hypothetical protein
MSKKINRIFHCKHGVYNLEIEFESKGQEVIIYSIKSTSGFESWLIDEEEIIQQAIKICKEESEAKDE